MTRFLIPRAEIHLKSEPSALDDAGIKRYSPACRKASLKRFRCGESGAFIQPMALDPANVIAAASAYNFYYGVTGLPGGTYGFKKIATQSSIG